MGYIVNSMMMAIVYISIGGRAGNGTAVAEGFDWEFLAKHYLYIRWWMLRLAMDHGPSERRERRGHRHINLPVAQHHRQYIFSTPLPMPAFTFTRPLLKIACGVCFWWTAQGTRTTNHPHRHHQPQHHHHPIEHFEHFVSASTLVEMVE